MRTGPVKKPSNLLNIDVFQTQNSTREKYYGIVELSEKRFKNGKNETFQEVNYKLVENQKDAVYVHRETRRGQTQTRTQINDSGFRNVVL